MTINIVARTVTLENEAIFPGIPDLRGDVIRVVMVDEATGKPVDVVALHNKIGAIGYMVKIKRQYLNSSVYPLGGMVREVTDEYVDVEGTQVIRDVFLDMYDVD